MRFLIAAAVFVGLIVLGKLSPDPPEYKPPAPKTREEAVSRLSDETGYSREEIRRAMNHFERNR